MGEKVETEQNYEIESDEFPWACFICRGDFKDPIVTRCQHVFCQNCAVQHDRADTKRAVCGRPTDGFFSHAGKLVRVLQKRIKEGKKKPAELIDDEGSEDRPQIVDPNKKS